MRYIIIGAGAIGSIIAKDIALEDDTKEVCIADIHLDFAKDLADEIGAKATARKLDLYDDKMVREAIRGFDVVVNSAGPFYKTARHIIEACIDEKVDYMDIADDSSAVNILLEYDDRCKEAEISALICMGVSPGTTNMLGLLGSEVLDTTDEIHTNWVVSSFTESNKYRNLGATYYHAIEMSTGTNPQFIDGEMVEVPSATGGKDIPFGSPLGMYPAHYVGHGEPITLAEHIKGVKTVTNRGNLWPIEGDVSNLRVFEQLGISQLEPINVAGVEVSRRDVGVALLLQPLEGAPESLPEGVQDVGFQVHVEVIGQKDNQDMTLEYTLFTEMNPATALSASYGAQYVAKHKGKMFGILAPEQYIETKDYFEHMKTKGFDIYVSTTTDKGQTKPEPLNV
ncbi:MAG TPA: saccharopine dehydrogenase NADP-binding domain-containing protein [Erysipelothrix sp.]|nr:saccharopine dehydrogenase NADP-binding domain-containing protein [Erysipelothrix sp.]